MKLTSRRGGRPPQRRSAQPARERYRVAIPSREDVLQVLERAGCPLGPDTLFQALAVEEQEVRNALGNRLRAMIRDGQLIVNRRGYYCLVGHIGLVSGVVTGHRDGYGFVTPDSGGDDIYLSAHEMREAMHGDRVAVRITRTDARGRAEGKLVEVLARNTREIVGRYVRESGIGFVVPDNRRFSQSVVIPPRQAAGAKPGDIVVVELTEPPSHETQPVGRVIENLGEAGGAGMETEIAMRSHALPFRWPMEALAEAQHWGDCVKPIAKEGRHDLRDVPLLTIDGADAKDFDDAVWCQRQGKGWRLIVAIADVSYYVPAGGALDGEARARGTSVYFPRKVVPMLPEALSNGLCSLNPGVDRLCMVCEMKVGTEGEVRSATFYEGLMRSHARLTYDEVAGILGGTDPLLRRQHGELVPHLESLHELWQALAKARAKRGAVDFDLPEVMWRFDPKGHIARIEPRHRNDAHRIIEECMIAANVEAARFLEKARIPTLFRVHAAPDEDRLGALREFLGAFGLKLPTRERLESRHFSALVEQVAGRPDADLIETVVLRSMKQAAYQPENIGHFGLALQSYAHFTSPIRRYPDLLVHRAIRHVVRGGAPETFSHDLREMEAYGRECSMAERRAEEATRDAADWLKCQFMRDRIGEEFDAVVIGVVDFGLFVQLPEYQIEGLIHISALGGDYYHRDPVHQRLVGERSGRVFRLSDALAVRLIRVSMEDRKIDFELLEEEPGPVGKRREGRKPRGTKK